MSNNQSAALRFAAVQQRITQAASDAGRDPSHVTLVGAAKQQSPAHLQQFIALGLRDVGENYLQEAIAAQNSLTATPARWHYIGKIQSNKTTAIAEHFDWVHSIDRLKIARRLSDQSPADKTLNVLVQVDIDSETSKGGVKPKLAEDLCRQINELPNLRLRGLMVLPRARQGLSEQREPFQRTRELLDHINSSIAGNMDTLSMGMSNDLEAAILEGSTMVRIGTDLFGPRGA